MKTMSWLKNLGVMCLVLVLAAGCASSKKSEDDDAERRAAQAIASAQSAIEEAAALGAEWRDAQSVLDEAKAAYEAGDYENAIKLANKAEAMARAAIAAMKAASSSGTKSYTVSRGDNLWNISGKSSVYGDPYRWPLIYKANKSKINDADLIHPGQVFDYETAPSAAAVSAAVQHAKTRGAWSVGAVEASDEAYLAR